MSDVPLHDVGHQTAPARDELLAASAITQFYTFASRCMDWASTTRSLPAEDSRLEALGGHLWPRSASSLGTMSAGEKIVSAPREFIPDFGVARPRDPRTTRGGKILTHRYFERLSDLISSRRLQF
jgi:hypothetical protein